MFSLFQSPTIKHVENFTGHTGTETTEAYNQTQLPFTIAAAAAASTTITSYDWDSKLPTPFSVSCSPSITLSSSICTLRWPT